MLRIALLCLSLLVAVPALAAEVDLELVLAADGSGSIDDDELRLQREGYAAALTSTDVLEAITKGPTGRIAVLYLEWGSLLSQPVIVPWQIIATRADAERFAQALRITPRAAWGWNSISGAIDAAVRHTETNAFQGLRKVIDVSGDGPHYGGRPVEVAREEAVALGYTINALAIIRPGGSPRIPGGGSLTDYYRSAVIGGPGAFVEVADQAQPFADAVRKKLITEIAAMPAALRAAQR